MASQTTLLDALFLVGQIFRSISKESKTMDASSHLRIPEEPCVVVKQALEEGGDLRANIEKICRNNQFNIDTVIDIDAVIDYANALADSRKNKPPLESYNPTGAFDIPD
ncbi:hypothetical protein [Alkalinema sp. FACHB-956]|uniref:hypothetical protein n=1 Tax=Alkalinema sp. FACHB-956 TaxID=2692768 RepID=UPI00168435F3|nr:hypothetical protein [Alkalinema sp. FACHB-956]MBD2327666.1 hypothetical protein [Alkalinema sp. FACHB-956]